MYFADNTSDPSDSTSEPENVVESIEYTNRDQLRDQLNQELVCHEESLNDIDDESNQVNTRRRYIH